MNSDCNGQYPEALMKVQDRQGFCLFIDVKEASYIDAKMYAAFYAKDNDGMWKEIRFEDGSLSDFEIDEDGFLQYKNEELSTLQVIKEKLLKKRFCRKK